ncbi:Prolyl oligopeptidase family protein [Rosistilla carotiformis]|uniref:Prolyl oligopeptidase family protein n=1 Tax=Rosistilla carotiformis TaxID=2528017 RepID=A0A518JVQ3_9BACT|nr:prolyl oligopeptidase family serine peptidase [Rosistilla carotiformis]QDV69619.1 Prolyl oligopeptidase family protein [Rosistilla carotiformis]
MRSLFFSFSLVLLSNLVLADGPADNHATTVRPVPPVGIEMKPADRDELLAGLEKLNAKIQQIRDAKEPLGQALLPDVEIFARAIRDAVAHRELFAERDVNKARQVLAEGLDRAEALAAGKAPWTTQTGLVVRGFRSRIDDTVQPYGMVVPESYSSSGATKHRLDLWLHGRGERSSEAVFIHERMNQVGRISPADTLVLHPYGRYCNAFKFAGEIDVLEALQHARTQYRVDNDRVSVRGFSMGGAGCWQLAVHYPSLFFAANPGAGFSETPEFLRTFQSETLDPTWYEKKLWQMYDCTGYAANLFNLPTVAYSGELDKQKQAADIMEQAMQREGLRLTHLIGPETKHTIHPDSLQLIERKLASLARGGRDRLPETIDFATYTLRYNKSFWLTVTELESHWEKATVRGGLQGEGNTVRLSVAGVNGLRIELPAGTSPFDPRHPVNLELTVTGTDSAGEGFPQTQMIAGPQPESDRSWVCEVYRDGATWKLGRRPSAGLQKRHALQGPIDDAFMDRFILVEPTSPAAHPAIEAWTRAEFERMVTEWRRQFRGDAIVRRDVDLTDEEIANCHLILFGDPSSNSVLGSIADQLPIGWNDKVVTVGEQSFDAAHHAPVMIYPNPKNPTRYVVINSGFTYRTFAYLNNARQVPKLPDWAVIDVRTPADSLWPGKVVDANFFDESWQLR